MVSGRSEGDIGNIASAVIGYARTGLPPRLGEFYAYATSAADNALAKRHGIVPTHFRKISGGGRLRGAILGTPPGLSLIELGSANAGYFGYIGGRKDRESADRDGGTIPVTTRRARISR